MAAHTLPDYPHDFEIRIRGRMDASNRTHADFLLRNGLSLNTRVWDAVTDFVIDVTPDPIERLRRTKYHDKHNPKDDNY